MLLSGINHVAILTSDTDRLCDFYREVFDAGVDGELRPDEGTRITFLNVGATSELNVLSVFFRDPDGLECEVCVSNPAVKPGVFNPPGTPAPGY